MIAYYITVRYKPAREESMGFLKKYRYLNKESAERVLRNYKLNKDIAWASLEEKYE